MLRKNKVVAVCWLFLLMLLVTSCAFRQGGVIETYDKLTLTYDLTARTLARTCVYHNVPKETCDKWGQQVNQARIILLEMGKTLDTILSLSSNPMQDPTCKSLIKACPPNDAMCVARARRMCLRRYYDQYYTLQRQVAKILRTLSMSLTNEAEGGE